MFNARLALGVGILAVATAAAPAHAAYLTYTFKFDGSGQRAIQDRNGDVPVVYQTLQGSTLTFGFNVEEGDLNAGGLDNFTNFGFGTVGNSLTFQFTSEPGQSNVFATGNGSACLLASPVQLPMSAAEFKPDCGAVSYSYSTRSGFTDTFSGALTSVEVTRSDERGSPLFSVVGYVPEPSTWALMLAGFGMMAYALRKRPKLSYAL